MSYKWLKWTRVIIALVVFFFTALIFIDFRELIKSENVIKVVWIQFIPSFIKFITIFSITATGFLVVIILTALLGRVYCSAICPFGILQDFVSRAGKFFKFYKRFKYRKPNLILRYSLLGLVLLSLFSGSIILVNVLDPFSVFGKFANGLLRPVTIGINNTIAALLESRGIYYLYHIDHLPLRISKIALPVVISFVVLLMAGKYGRLYCNTICPVGTVLGLLSKVSLFRIAFDQSKCTKCGSCTFSCKAECINIKELMIDHSRCVACFNCLSVCPEDAMHYKLNFKVKPSGRAEEADMNKRKFIISAVGGFIFVSGAEKVIALSGDIEPLNKKPTTIPEEKNYPVSPPGSLSINHFTSLCTACQLCVSKCPTGVLQPSYKEYGLTGFMQPFMDFNTNYCNYDCVRCSKVCPTGAILTLTDELKHTVQIGKVKLIIENCVVFTENTACGSCSEHCPTQAVRMIPYHSGLTIPEINESICVGCGACEYACPVRPYKAIYVDGNPIHEIASKPDTEIMEGGILEDFPF